MISMRYHIVSLAAVFLALALGIVLGATKISSPLLSGLQGDNAELASQQQQLSTENQDLANRVTADEKFAGAVGALTVRGTLPKTNVVLITTAGADPADRDAVLSLLARAGATVTAQIQLTNDFSDPARAEELRALAAKTLPTGAKLPEVPQVGAIAGGLLGSVLVVPSGGKAATPEQSAAVLSALTSAGFITVTGEPAPGSAVVLLTGGELAGTVGVIRGDTALSANVTTVDNVDTATGRIAAVLGLVEQNGGGVGRYGLGENAQAQVPTLAVG
jgi:hypothetical protein